MLFELFDSAAGHHEIRQLGRRETIPRKTAELACVRVLGLNHQGKIGIVGFSATGENYPELWNGLESAMRPYMFSSSVPNSVIGHCSVALGLKGPQIVLTDTSVNMQTYAELQLHLGRADGMIMLRNEGDRFAAEYTAVLLRRRDRSSDV